MADGPLNVVALISGGKDSFYSILHCLANGHRVIALANLHPPPRATSNKTTPSTDGAETGDGTRLTSTATITAAATIQISPSEKPAPRQHRPPPGIRADHDGGGGGGGEVGDEDETDLNSFMYQTVGHQVIPLYAQATGLPLFRRPILGTAVHHGISYQNPSDDSHRQQQLGEEGEAHEQDEEDETESLVPLLRAVLKAHPEVNALCTGAILSTYQRTRVESVALRLGLVPLGYLWQYPELPLPANTTPQPSTNGDDAQLLRDMGTAGLEARVVKVASAGLGEDFLWANVASEAWVARAQRALRRFGGGGKGAVLGEGGEFETLVVDGPLELFKGRIVVEDEDRRVVREGGGSAWLNIRQAKVEMKEDVAPRADGLGVRIPGLLDLKFEGVLEALRGSGEGELGHNVGLSQILPAPPSLSSLKLRQIPGSGVSQNWHFVGGGHGECSGGVENQTARIVQDIRQRLHGDHLPATAITNSVILLRRMADFPTVNKLYGALFREPNPPARVTISCGDLLPQDANISILLTVQPSLRTRPGDRRGLHVQSRSYWAPANIGPYSQAITFPLLPMDEGHAGSHSDSSLTVSIAGQIPLLPASMTLPPPDDSAIQITLALQHLWRVGAEMHVRWWSSAVAYFPRSTTSSSTLGEMGHQAVLAATAWKTAHVTSLANAEDEASGPDPWDRKYNPLYMSFGGGSDAEKRPTLPDWEVVRGFESADDSGVGDNNGGGEETQQRPLPFMFSAEVEELPRLAGVEWHAHMGLANVGPGSVHLYSVAGGERGGISSSAPAGPDLHHVVVEAEASAGGVFVQTLAVYRRDGFPAASTLEAAVDCAVVAVGRSLAKLLPVPLPLPLPLASPESSSSHSMPEVDAAEPKLTYVELDAFATSLKGGDSALEKSGPIIPCRSLWDPSGERLAMVSVFETRFARAG
ncbi:hypothetical protein AAE478_000155 [Parahypoxylon ruwenzoriense]